MKAYCMTIGSQDRDPSSVVCDIASSLASRAYRSDIVVDWSQDDDFMYICGTWFAVMLIIIVLIVVLRA
ncbi:hypothetical protein DPMN_179194 [Dreissena polymorpha]|uniref:Uncharacterized protein n=1 Tax=Dreissena polymorpha TaxID=45954 RepID=A0A9D4EFL6_DREPO|nr:hypothetical protein DPMN_179194 [Dreissena polymorpha]